MPLLEFSWLPGISKGSSWFGFFSSPRPLFSLRKKQKTK
jgi:hypothetical protein